MPALRINRLDGSILTDLQRQRDTQKRSMYFEELISGYMLWKRENADSCSQYVPFIDNYIKGIQDNVARAAFIEYVQMLKASDLALLFKILHIQVAPSAPLENASNADVNHENEAHVDLSLLLKNIPAEQAHGTFLSPELAQFKLFQQWICGLTPKQRYQFNQWLKNVDPSDVEKNHLFRVIMQEQLESRFRTKNSYRKQREFIRWYDEQQEKMFKKYAAFLPEADKNVFEHWIKAEYHRNVSLAKQSLTQGMKDHYTSLDAFLAGTEINKLVNSVNTQLENIRAKIKPEYLSHIYFNGASTPTTWYNQRLDELCWKQHKDMFLKDPHDEVIHTMILPIVKPSAPIKPILLSEQKKQPTVLPTASVVKANENSNSNAPLVVDVRLATADELNAYGSVSNPLNPEERMSRDEDVPPSSSSSSARNVERSYKKLKTSLEALYTKLELRKADETSNEPNARKTVATAIFPKDQYERQNSLLSMSGIRVKGNANRKLTGTDKIETVDFNQDEKNEEKKWQELPKAGYKYTEDLLCETMSSDQKDLIQAWLQENEELLNDFIQDYAKSYCGVFASGIIAYASEFLYLGADFITRINSVALVLAVMGVGLSKDDSDFSLIFNILATVLVASANLTFDPKADARDILIKMLLNPNQSLLEALFLKNAKKDPLFALAFLVMAASGAAVDILPLEVWLKPALPSLVYPIVYSISSALIIGSGISYYFSYNFESIMKNSEKGKKYLALAWEKCWDPDPEERAVARVALLHMRLAMMERTLRMAFGPYIFVKGFEGPTAAALFAAGVGGFASYFTTYALRDVPIGKTYFLENHPKVTREMYNDAFREYEEYVKNNPLQAQINLLLDPSTSVVIGAAGIIPMILCDALKLSGTDYGFGFALAASLITKFLLDQFEPAARRKIIMAAAQDASISDTAKISCGFDQASRAIGMVFIMQLILPFVFSTSTMSGRTAIMGLLAIECFLSYAAYLYQAESVDRAQKTVWDTFSQTSFYRGFKAGLKDPIADCLAIVQNSCTTGVRNCSLAMNSRSLFGGKPQQKSATTHLLGVDSQRSNVSNTGAELHAVIRNDEDTERNGHDVRSTSPYKAMKGNHNDGDVSHQNDNTCRIM